MHACCTHQAGSTGLERLGKVNDGVSEIPKQNFAALTLFLFEVE
jgi:hypothetical protein